VLHHVKSFEHEKLVIENAHFGRMMMIDGVVQLSAVDEFIYHEMMSHVPLLAHGRVERVLIVGGGDCGLAEEVLKHRSVRRVLQVESDPQLVRLARTYLGKVNESVFHDARFQLRIADGADFVTSTDERFDLVLVSSRALNGPMATEAFYRDARGCLRPGGLLLTRLDGPYVEPLRFSAAMKNLATLFPVASCYLVSVPSVLGGPVAVGWASSVLRPDALPVTELVRRYEAASIDMRYYTPELHQASFALPRFLEDAVDVATRGDQTPSSIRMNRMNERRSNQLAESL
jgi:spermidine synthase